MQTLFDNLVSDNAVADEVSEVSAPAPTEQTPAVDPSVAKLMAKIEAGVNEITLAAIELYDNKDSLRKHAKLGGVVIKNARGLKKLYEKAALDRGATRRFEANDLKEQIDSAKRQVMLTTTLASRDIKIDVDVRVYMWVEAVRPFAPNVENLSYRTVANYLLPTLNFDKANLTAEISKGWTVFVAETVALQLGSHPINGTALAERIAAHAKSLEEARKEAMDPEKRLEQERKAAIKEQEKARDAAKDKIVTGVNDALNGKTGESGLVVGKMSPSDVMDVVERIFESCDAPIPLTKSMLASVATMSESDAKRLVDLMVYYKNFDALDAIRRRLNAMDQTVPTLLTEPQAAAA